MLLITSHTFMTPSFAELTRSPQHDELNDKPKIVNLLIIHIYLNIVHISILYNLPVTSCV